MANQKYKHKFTEKDIALLDAYVQKVHGSLYIEVVDNSWNDGYDIDLNSPSVLLGIQRLQHEAQHCVKSTTDLRLCVLQSNGVLSDTLYFKDGRTEGIVINTLKKAKELITG